ncbi:MAG: response regulator [Promethearchaeota archaeon]
MKKNRVDFKIAKSKKTKEMVLFEEETGKKAIWQEKITASFKKWKKGEKIYSYNQDIEKVVTYLNFNTKDKWIKFAHENEYSSISKLLRLAVSYLIDITNLLKGFGERTNFKSVSNLTTESIKNYYQKEKFTNSEIFHDLKEPLSLIRGFSNLILDDLPQLKKNHYFQELDKSCLDLEDRLKYYFESSIVKHSKYNVLLIDDDIGTTKLVSEHFRRSGVSFKCVFNTRDALKELNSNIPKLILLDIFLPDMMGDKFCKKLKSNIKYKDIPIVYLTAIPKKEAEKKKNETGANGLILKPFDFEDFKFVSNFLK